ncbi:alpha-amylase family glycosyl hydrolase [[Mycoplasma] collis]|uniref:alpha-amylase family glycosyl hydrolase n=1 Tax=[Mycoplasma] collis TaxID=2127 RepID=UPI0012EC35EB|nr:alpha-amylase family glycosyl hydrolase [[Mycoplasma] collis]
MNNKKIDKITKYNKNIKQIDKLYYTTTKLGLYKQKSNFILKFWAPLAEKVLFTIYDSENRNKIVDEIDFVKKNKIWEVKISLKYLNYFYHIKIIRNNKEFLILDPYAKAIETFDWKGKTNLIPKAVIVDWENELNKIENIKLNKQNNENVIIYELHIRDFTSLSKNNNIQNRKGTFNAAIENNIFDYLNNLNVNFLQLLPIHSIYTLNDNNLNIINKNQANKWTTNYNWGYDPMNYFSLNGWYFNNPHNYNSRFVEFKNFINKAHEKKIGIIIDVVFNHLMINKLFENIVPNYYFRNKAKIFPVNQPPFNSQAKMVRKLILDSLIYLVKYFDVDGFRFDLSTFIDKQTLNIICKKLKKIKPDIILHGEAWQFSDLNYQDSFTKGINFNNHDFAYFNDTLRNAIKGSDSVNLSTNDYGLIQGNLNYLNDFLISIVGNSKAIKTNLKLTNKKISYEVFAKNPKMALQYSACHDGFTLWDKIITTTNLSFRENLKLYRQALIMQFSSQGKQLILAGSEFLQTKPTDFTGQDSEISLKIINNENSVYDNENLFVNSNSYKTSDYTNGLKWDLLKNNIIENNIYNFLKKLLNFYKNSKFFNLNLKNKKIIFHKIDKGYIYYEIKVENSSLFIIHNFNNKKIELKNIKIKKIIFNSDFDTENQNILNYIPAKSSLIFE